jgi:hypothetical protein
MRALVAGLAFGFLVAGSASAQYVISAHSGVIQYVEGTAYLSDKPVQPKAGEFPNIKENQIFRTEQGMAEVLLTPGVFLRLGENSSIKMVSATLSDTRVEVLGGTAMVECDDLEKDNAIMLLYKGNSMLLVKHGLYRVDAEQGSFKVYDGEAIVKAESGQLTLHKGKETSLNGVLMAENFDVKDEDALYRWSDRRSGYLAKANVSSANSLAGSGGAYGYYPGYGFGGWNGWMFNPLFGMYTFVPYDGFAFSPFGYGFWSPYTVWQSPYFGGGGGGLAPGVSRNTSGGGKHAPYVPVRGSVVARAVAGGHAVSGGGFPHASGGAVSGGSAASAGGHSSGGGGHR